MRHFILFSVFQLILVIALIGLCSYFSQELEILRQELGITYRPGIGEQVAFVALVVLGLIWLGRRETVPQVNRRGDGDTKQLPRRD